MAFRPAVLAAAAALATVILAPLAAFGQDAVVATVNGRGITEAELRFAEAEIGGDLGTIPPATKRRVLIEYLIESQLFAEAADGAKLGQGAGFDQRMAYWRRRAMRDTFFDSKVRDSVSEAEARQLYEQQVGGAGAKEEIRAAHILVETEEKAKEIFEKIAYGADFAQMARQFSRDPGTKDMGGNLGYFVRGQMVPQFEAAAFKLTKGEVSFPVQTQFGWHLIRVEDKRQRSAPPFEEVKAEIMASLVHQKAQLIAGELRGKARVEYVDPEIKAQVEAERRATPQSAPQRK